MIFYSNGYDHWMWDDAELSAAARCKVSTRNRVGTALFNDATARKTLADAENQRGALLNATINRGRYGEWVKHLSATWTARRC